MDRAWKHYTSTPEPPKAPTATPAKSRDMQYAGDYATLVVIFRTRIAEGARQHDPVSRLASQLRQIATLLLDDFGATDSQHFLRKCVEDHGPEILLLALAKAYAEPVHVLGELEGD